MNYLRLIAFILILLVGQTLLFSQEKPPVDSLKTVVVTATLNPEREDAVPMRINRLDESQLAVTPVTNADELLTMVPGVFVNRSWGIFSKNSSVTMRGLSGSARVLVLLDGVPLNRAGGGGINWHMIGPEQLSHIEVLSGPASSLYGQNSMGGVIQLFSSKPSDSLMLQAGLEYGSFNTKACNLSAGKAYKKGKVYWSARAFYREGDGYILTDDSLRTAYDKEAFLEEGNLHLSAGCELLPGHETSFTWIMQHDKRGSGIKVFEPRGSFNSYLTQLYSLKYQWKISPKTRLSLGISHQSELLESVDEKYNTQGLYKLVDTEMGMQDIGVMINITHLYHSHQLTAGADIRSGYLANLDLYRTSTDRIESGGNLKAAGIFVQDEYRILPDRLFLVAGVRVDAALFSDGYLTVAEPTQETGFTEDINSNFSQEGWQALSPKIGLRYKLHKNAGFYISAGRGFSPPKLNDLTSSGKIRKGFKLANPELGPELIDNYEIGANFNLFQKLTLTPSIYYSIAGNLQYQVSTGDSMDVAGVLKPVFQVRNVAGVDISGAEIKAEWNPSHHLALFGIYSYSRSLIQTQGETDPLLSKLDGKQLSEVPQHLASAGILMRYRQWFGKADWSYTGSLWYDDENTLLTEDYHLFNIKAGYQITPQFLFTVTVQDLFDNVHTDKKGMLSPGRFILTGLRFRMGLEP